MLLRGWWGSDDVVSPAGRRDMGVAEDDLCQRLGLMRQLGLKEEGSCRLLIGISQYVSNWLWSRLVVVVVVMVVVRVVGWDGLILLNWHGLVGKGEPKETLQAGRNRINWPVREKVRRGKGPRIK